MDGIRIILTSEDRQQLLDAIDKSDFVETLQDDRQNIEQNSLTVEALRKIQKNVSEIHVSTITNRSRIILTNTEPERPKRSAELEARLEMLRLKQENAAYRRMTKDIDPAQRARLGEGEAKREMTIGQEIRAVSRQMTVIINILLTVAGSFFFGYFGLPLALPGYNFQLPGQIIAGMVLGMLTFFADLWFLFRSMLEEDEKTVKRD